MAERRCGGGASLGARRPGAASGTRSATPPGAVGAVGAAPRAGVRARGVAWCAGQGAPAAEGRAARAVPRRAGRAAQAVGAALGRVAVPRPTAFGARRRRHPPRAAPPPPFPFVLRPFRGPGLGPVRLFGLGGIGRACRSSDMTLSAGRGVAASRVRTAISRHAPPRCVSARYLFAGHSPHSTAGPLIIVAGRRQCGVSAWPRGGFSSLDPHEWRRLIGPSLSSPRAQGPGERTISSGEFLVSETEAGWRRGVRGVGRGPAGGRAGRKPHRSCTSPHLGSGGGAPRGSR